jgi:two-component system, OmpR family, response regulator
MSMGENDRRKLLIVEDDEDTLEALVAFFEHPGIAVETARSGAAALREVDHFAPHVVLLDVMLPTMDGFEVFSRIHRVERAPRVILMTASAEPGALRFAETLGAYGTLMKPFNYELLRKMVHGALEVAPASAGTPRPT